MSWFKEWFNTPYYHILYKDRDFVEAENFIRNLTQDLQLSKDSKIIDLACGKGRHSVFLQQLGYEVLGVDLSEESIEHNKQFETSSTESPKLTFEVHDMRNELYPNISSEKVNAVFNLFTSFGYFDEPADDKKVLDAIFTALRPGGLFVFDYLHAAYVEETHVPSEEIEVDGVRFSVSRHITAAWIVKQIQVQDGDDAYRFFEKVRNYSPQQLEDLLQTTGFSVLRKFGNYQLEPPSPESPRCLFICQK